MNPTDLLAATSVRVLRGAPSPEELAAFTAVLTLRLTPAADPVRPRPSTAAWSRPDRARPYTSPRAWHT
ncbi:acyl-CoA carboxylase subunit epsilon [Streptomyces sp. NPDC003333]